MTKQNKSSDRNHGVFLLPGTHATVEEAASSADALAVTLGYRREDLNYPEKYELYIQMNAGGTASSDRATINLSQMNTGGTDSSDRATINLSAQNHATDTGNPHGGSVGEVDSGSTVPKDDSAGAKMDVEVHVDSRVDDHGSAEAQSSRHGKRKAMDSDTTGSGPNDGGANVVDDESDDDDDRSSKTARVDGGIDASEDENAVAISSPVAASEVARHEGSGAPRTRYK